MIYVINYQTGIKDEVDMEDLEEVKEFAEERMAYTKENVTIETEEGEVLSISRWYGVSPDEEDEDSILLTFGEYGFYQKWVDEN
jgi:hypothetical protein